MNLAQAQSRHDNSLPREVTAPDDSAVIDEMMADADMVAGFAQTVTYGTSVGTFMSLMLDRGFPRKDGSERDDNYRDRLDALLETLHDQFTEWAYGPNKYGAPGSRIDKFREWMS
jgi:hypothetical protein